MTKEKVGYEQVATWGEGGGYKIDFHFLDLVRG